MGRGPHRITQLTRQLAAGEKLLARLERAAKRRRIAQAKVRSRRRPTCRCRAYPWPHRPGGGLCRYPDPPQATWQGAAGQNQPAGRRYRGLVKTLCQKYRLHPIRDRQCLERLMARLYPAWCQRYWPGRWQTLWAWGRLDGQGRLRICRRRESSGDGVPLPTAGCVAPGSGGIK